MAGYYGYAPAILKPIANTSSNLLVDSIDKIKLNVDKADVFYICDYGTGDGLTSMPVIYSAVEKIKETFGGEQNIHVMYEDQPLNEFKQIFLKLNGMYVSFFLYTIFYLR